MAKDDETFFPFNASEEAWEFVFRQAKTLKKHNQLGRFTLRVEKRGDAYVAILKQVKD